MMMLTEETLQEYREYLICEEKTEITIAKYMRDIHAFKVFLANRTITKEVTVSYKQSLIEKGYKESSINSMLASLNSLLDFLSLPECKVKVVRMQRKTYCAKEKELTKAEYFRLLDAAKDNPRLALILETICATGIRVSELKCFTVESVRSGEVQVRCKNKSRVILVPRKLRGKLLQYVKKIGTHQGAIFVTKTGNVLDRSYIWAQMKALSKKARVAASKIFPHNLRKLFARTFYEGKKDIAKLADVLGHSSINTTRIYIMTTGVQHLRQIERLGLVS